MEDFVNPEVPVVDLVPTDSERSYAMLIHLSALLGYIAGPLAIIVPLVMWMTRREESAYANDHGREAVNFNISIWLYTLVAGLLMFVVIGCFILPAIIIFHIIAVIMAAVRANAGQFYRYPVTVRFIPA